jgi:AbiV family abortive infection protein
MAADRSGLGTQPPVSFPELSIDQLWELRTGVLQNAKRLVQDAEYLLANGRWPGAYESAYFAREETAKSAVVFAAAYVVAQDPTNLNWPKFWKAWRDHQMKSAGFVMMSALYARVFEGSVATEDAEAEASEAAALRRQREAALYVSWDGGLKTPLSSITEGQARDMVAEASKMVEAELASTDAHRAEVEAARSK